MPDRGKFYHPNGLRVKRRHAPLALRRRLRVGIGDWGLGIGGIGDWGLGGLVFRGLVVTARRP